MRSLAAPFLLSILALPAELVGAVRLGIRQKPGAVLQRRAGSSLGASTLTDASNLNYYVNITLGGEQFEVLIDTGRRACIVGNVECRY